MLQFFLNKSLKNNTKTEQGVSVQGAGVGKSGQDKRVSASVQGADNKNARKQCGRSMVEMLGVLAIIGVLSIGGIQGYTLAMRKYRANQVLQAAAMYANLTYIGAINYVNNNSEYFEIKPFNSKLKNLEVIAIKRSLPTELYRKVKAEWENVLMPYAQNLGLSLPSTLANNIKYAIWYDDYFGERAIFKLNDNDFIRVIIYFNEKEVTLCKTVSSMVTNVIPEGDQSNCRDPKFGPRTVVADFYMN